MRKPKPPRPGRPGNLEEMPMIRPNKPGMPGMVKPPSMTKPPKPGSKPYPMPRVTDDMGMKEQAKKRALEMMMGRNK
jgi:hypothetical protein